MRLWVGRALNGWYEIGNRRKAWDTRMGFIEQSTIVSIKDSDFEALFGFSLVPGAVKRINNITMDYKL